MLKSFFSFSLVLTCLPILGVGQTIKEIKAQIESSYEEINRLRDSTYSLVIEPITGKIENNSPKGNYEDSIESTTLELSNYLKINLPKIRESPVDTGDNLEMVLASSHDKKMRIWTWNISIGDSMPFYYNVVEYSTPKGIKVVNLEYDNVWMLVSKGANNWFDTIYSVTDAYNKIYYIARATWRADGRISDRGIYAFTVDDTVLNTCPRVFKDKHTDSLSGEDSIMCYINVEDYDCPPAIIKMDSSESRLYIQHIAFKENNKGYLTSKWEVYEFNGRYFEYKGIKRK